MNEPLAITIPGVPTPKRRPRFARCRGHVRTYDTQSDEKQTMQWQLKARMQKPPLHGSLYVEMKFYMPIPKSTSKKNKEQMLSGVIKHTKKPDCDNLIKMPLDCMNGIVFEDDRQIYELKAVKLYSENPRTEITIWQESNHDKSLEDGQPLSPFN